MSNEAKRPGNQQNQYQPEYQPGKQKNSQKTTAVALSVVTCLFMCILGYQIIQSNPQKASIKSPVSHDPEISRRYTYSEPTQGHSGDDDEYLSYELKVLREQNRRQAAKIKSLKQEIVNRLQEQHDLKSTLFKQEGDPRDRARIAELNHQLAQKEMTTLQLQQQLKELEAEKQGFDKKILHAEVTKEALTNMLEQQRTLRDQEIAKLKAQLTEYQKQKETEQNEITMQLLQYEDTHQRLNESLEHNTYATFYLNSEINNLRAELDETHKAREERESTLYEQLYNTIASMELTEIQAATLKNKLNKAYLRHNKSLNENNARIAKLEKEISQHRKNLKEKNALFESVHDLYSVALLQTKTEIDEVSGQFESEKNKSLALEQELAKQLETQKSLQESYKTLKKDHKLAKEVEKKLNDTNEKMTLLQAELDIHKFSLEEREHHLEQLQQGKVSLEAKYQEKIRNLASTLKSEQEQKSGMDLQIEYLSGKLEVESARHQLTKSALSNLENTLQDLENKLQHTAKLEKELQNTNAKMASLNQELEFHQTLLENKDRQLGANLQKERDVIARLERELENQNSILAAKHEELDQIENSKKELESDLHEHIASLTNDLNQERDYILTLETELRFTNEQLEREKAAHEASRVALLDYKGTQESLSDQHRRTAQLEKSLEHSTRVADELQLQLEYHQALLQSKGQQHAAITKQEKDKVTRMQEELERHKADIASKHQQLDDLGSVKSQLESELHQRIASLTNELNRERETQSALLAAKEHELQQERNALKLLVATTEKELQRERDQIASLQNDLQSSLDQLTHEKSAHEQTRLSLIDHNASIQSLDDQHRYSAKLEKSLQESLQQAAGLQAEVNSLQAQISTNERNHQKLLDQENEQIATLENEIDVQKSIIASKEQELYQLAVLKEESRYHYIQSKELETRLEQQSQETELLNRELAATSQRTAQLQEELNRQLSLAETYEQRIRDLQNQKGSEIAQLQSNLDFYAELVEGKEQSLRQYEEREEELHRQFTAEIAQMTANAEKEALQSRKLRDQLNAVEEQYASEKEASISLQQQLQRSKQSVAQLESEINRYQAERSDSSKKITALEAQLNDLLHSSRARETAEAKRFDKFNVR